MDTKALRQKILDLAIRGKLVPQDPNDEPASVLLERIRAEKQQMVKDGKLKAKDIKNDTVIFKGDDNLHYEKFPDGRVKCIEDEIPFELPRGWEWCRFNCVLDVRDGTHDTPSYIPNGIPLITSKNLSEGGIDYSNVKYISHEDALLINERSGVDKGDILFAMIGTIGNPAMVSDDKLISIKNVALFKFTYSLNINHKYIMAYLDYTQDDMKKRPSGGLQPFVSLNFLRQYFVPIPPISEQHRIVDKLNELLSFVDTIETDKTSLQDLIKQTKSKILDLAIRGKLVPQEPNDEPASVLLERIRAEKEELIKQGKIKRDKKESVIFKGDDNSYYEKIGDEITCIDDEIPFEIPENWVFSRLKNIWELISGRDLSPSDYNGTEEGIPYITGASNFINGKVSLVRWTPKPQVITNYGDLLITCKGTIGEIAINDFGEAHIARQIMAIRNINNLNIDYLSLCLQFYIESIKQSAKGLIPGISREDVLNIILPVPPNKYQIVVVEAIQEYKEILNNIEANLN